MKTELFKSELVKCINTFASQIEKCESVNKEDIKIYICNDYLLLRYESEDDEVYTQEIEEINGELCNMNFIIE